MTTKDLDAFFEAGWNGHDVDLLMTFMSDDCVFESIAGPEACGTRHAGPERVREAFSRVFASSDTLYGGLAGPAPIHPRGGLAHYRILRYPFLGPIEGPTVRVKGSAHSVRNRRTHNLTSCPKLADAGRNARALPCERKEGSSWLSRFLPAPTSSTSATRPSSV